MATCQLLWGRCWISGVLLAAAEFTGGFMGSQICFSYPYLVNSRIAELSCGKPVLLPRQLLCRTKDLTV